MKKEKAIPYSVKVSSSGNNGYIVTIGCATLVFSNRESLELALHEYFRDPKKTIEEYETTNDAPAIFRRQA